MKSNLAVAKLTLAVLIVVAPQACYGSAFSLYEMGVRAAGMGTAFTAVADDASGTVVPEKGLSGTVKRHFLPLATMCATKQISPKMTLGFGAFTPFGLADNYTNLNDGDPNLTRFTGRFAGTLEGCLTARQNCLYTTPKTPLSGCNLKCLAFAFGPHEKVTFEQSVSFPRPKMRFHGSC